MEIEILTPRQKLFLELWGEAKGLVDKFYLTGGTVLAGFYLKHRYSEDLDFFSEDEVDLMAINIWLKGTQRKIGFKNVDFQQTFNRNLFFLHFNDEVLKTEFTYFPFNRIEYGKVITGVTIDSLKDIAVNKLFTIYQRSAARDYIDLYLVCRETGWRVSDLIAQARIKFDWHIDPLQLGAQFVKAEKAQDLPRMIEELALEEWRGFWLEEARKLKPEILKS